MARISALPLLVVSLTGWIPDNELELGPKGPWPWGALIGLSFIVVGLLGLLLPRETISKSPSDAEKRTRQPIFDVGVTSPFHQ